MGTHTAPVNRAGSNASDTSVAIAFSWAVGAGTGTNPVNAADFPGGTFPSGTGTIPAGSASATITFQSNPDTTFEQDETGILTLTTTQSGVTVTGSPQPFTITNDDADPGSGNTVVYGPQAVADSGFRQTSSPRHRVSWTFNAGQVANDIYLYVDDAEQTGIVFHQVDDTRYYFTSFSGGAISPNTYEASNTTFNPSSGQKIAVEALGSTAKVYINDVLFKTHNTTFNNTGTKARLNAWIKSNGSSVSQNVLIEALA